MAINRNEEEINKLTHKIIGCAMRVHSTLGNGFQEVIYQRALAIEFSYQGLEFQREMEMGLTLSRATHRYQGVDFFC